MKLADCRKPEDLEELDSRDYIRLVATPATLLDVLRLQLELIEALREHAAALNEMLEGLAQQRGG